MKMSCRGGADSHQNNNNNVREKSFRIRHDDLKLFSRFLSRQETSNRYYGDVSVPFVWESQPGTPKHRFADSAAALRPPLTPPPSYYSNSKFTPAGAPARDKKALRPGSILLRTLLTKGLRQQRGLAATDRRGSSGYFSAPDQRPFCALRERIWVRSRPCQAEIRSLCSGEKGRQIPVIQFQTKALPVSFLQADMG
nr:YLP motif-containing protein 1-like [Ipomoea batatas]